MSIDSLPGRPGYVVTQESRFNDPEARPHGFLLVIVDQSGPIGSMRMPRTWRHLEQSIVEQLVRTAHPSRDVKSVRWADDPKPYGTGEDVLLVEVPGTHDVAPIKPHLVAVRDVRDPDRAPRAALAKTMRAPQALEARKFRTPWESRNGDAGDDE